MSISLRSLLFTSDGAIFGSTFGEHVLRTNGVQHTAMISDAGSNQLLNIETDRGYALTCSGSQRLLTRQLPRGRRAAPELSWIEAHRLQPSDELVLTNNRSVSVDQSAADFRAGWVLGLIAGNGGHNQLRSGGTYLRFWDEADEPIIHEARMFVESLGVGPTFAGGSLARTHGTVTIRTIELGNFASAYLENSTKLVLPTLAASSNEMVAGFVRGIYDTDGSPQGSAQKGRSVRLSQSNREQLAQVQLMLARLGIASTIYLRRPAGMRLMPDTNREMKLYPNKDQWELVIANDNIERFAAIVGLSKSTKAATLKTLIRSVKRRPNVEPFVAAVTRVADGGWGASAQCDADGERFNVQGFIGRS